MLVYIAIITARVRYIVDFIGKEIAGIPFNITDDKSAYENHDGPKINYSADQFSAGEFWIKPHSLLGEQGIQIQQAEIFESSGQKAFFKTDGDFPFDVFAAAFYLISRYEEYLPHKKDKYGRYAFENSLAYKEGFLTSPLINVWLHQLNDALKRKFPGFTNYIPIASGTLFTFLPTYDIDIAWSYKHKGWWRNAGGLLRSLTKGQWSMVIERIQVLRGKQKDPFDAFGWMNNLHEQHKLKPYYFFLVPEKRGRYDKNISPSTKEMQELIRDHVIRYTVGIHPSWRSGDDPGLLKKEIETLSGLTGSPVDSSRQHYIRFNLPDGYRRLVAHGIKSDFSMGYGSINGFRASVASPFYWYDLEKEEPTELLLYPFCYMEANSFYEQKLSPQQALQEMHYYYKEVRSVNGHFIMIWHNAFLGTDQLYAGWREVYEQFIREVTAP